MRKFKVVVNININDIVELDDNLTDEEIEKELSEYMFDKLDWGYKEIEEDENKRSTKVYK